ncbi:hypothetical protein D1007_49347 [Hordeum vulgare]|nr:hypothetical protein D1007_49347 [Hordeum vulgare]
MMRPYGARTDNPPQLVVELIDATSATWDITRLEEVCLSIDVTAILEIPLCTSNISDSWTWFLEKNGCFSEHGDFERLWVVWGNRFLATFSTGVLDFPLHWALVDGELAEHLCEMTEPDAKRGLFTMIDCLSHEAFIRLSVTLWAIWWARRKVIHEQIFQSSAATHQFISRFIHELELLPCKERKKQPAPKPAVVKPKAPPSGYSKIHIDAAISKVPKKEAAAAVCRDGTGNFLGSSALVINGITDVATLEALACRVGISIAVDLLVHSFIIVSDSKQPTFRVYGNRPRLGDEHIRNRIERCTIKDFRLPAICLAKMTRIKDCTGRKEVEEMRKKERKKLDAMKAIVVDKEKIDTHGINAT